MLVYTVFDYSIYQSSIDYTELRAHSKDIDPVDETHDAFFMLPIHHFIHVTTCMLYRTFNPDFIIWASGNDNRSMSRAAL